MPENTPFDGEPETGIAAIRRRMGTSARDTEEFEAMFGDLPTDDEG
jgi:hypothetical protein